VPSGNRPGMASVIVITMSSKRFSVSALVGALALLVVGCSSGSGNHASPTTTKVTTSSTAATTTTLSPSYAVSSGACPSKYPSGSLAALNSGAKGLGTKLVPIEALYLRICQYGSDGLPARRAVLSGSGETVIENETNLLRRTQEIALAESPTGTSCLGPFYLTFASHTRHVSLTVTGCDAVTNGVFLAFGTTTWLSELAAYTGCTMVSPSTVSPSVGSPTTVDIGSQGPPSNGKGPTGATSCSSI